MNRNAARGAPRAHVARFTAEGNAHPRALPSTAAPPPKGSRRPDSFESAAGTHITGLISPSALSSKVSFGTTRKRTNRPATALQRFGPAPAGSYSGHSPTRPRLNHPHTTCGHRGATPAAIGLPRFAVIFVRPVTSVVGCPTGQSPHVRPSRGGAVSVAPKVRRFRGSEHRSLPLPISDWFVPGSAPSRVGLTGNGFRRSRG